MTRRTSRYQKGFATSTSLNIAFTNWILVCHTYRTHTSLDWTQLRCCFVFVLHERLMRIRRIRICNSSHYLGRVNNRGDDFITGPARESKTTYQGVITGAPCREATFRVTEKSYKLTYTVSQIHTHTIANWNSAHSVGLANLYDASMKNNGRER